MLDALPWRERRVIELRYGLGDEGPLTLEDIGHEVGRDPRARAPDRVEDARDAEGTRAAPSGSRAPHDEA